MTTNAAIKSYRWGRHSYERNGEIVEMCPQGMLHYTALSLLERLLREIFGAGKLVRSQAPFVVNDDSEPEPDLAVVKGSARDYMHEHPHSALLLVEISDSTLRYDRTVKAALYRNQHLLCR